MIAGSDVAVAVFSVNVEIIVGEDVSVLAVEVVTVVGINAVETVVEGVVVSGNAMERVVAAADKSSLCSIFRCLFFLFNFFILS
jgi:hypothetical protein